MIIRSILILTMLALVLGGVGAAVAQAQSIDLDPGDARHDDLKPDLDVVEESDKDGPDKRDSNAHHGHHHHGHHHHHHTCVT
ncbi:MAG: hypothetical protein WCP98_21620 [Actinomycetes bacterium]